MSATARHHALSKQLLFSWRGLIAKGSLGTVKWMDLCRPGLCRRSRGDGGACRCGDWHSGGRDREWPTRDRGSQRRCRGFAPNHARAGDITVIRIPTGVRVWLATGHTDIRCGFPSLALRVQEVLKRDAGGVFCFRVKRGDLLRIIWHDGRAPACAPKDSREEGSSGHRLPVNR